jgi:hypothetical protein
MDTAHAGTQADPFLATTLRAAVNAANSAADADTIVFDPTLFASMDRTLTLSTIGNTTFGASAFGITTDITLAGPAGGNGLTLAAAAGLRLFYISPTGCLTLQNLTVRGGSVTGSSTSGGAQLGGAVYVDDGAFPTDGDTLNGPVSFSFTNRTTAYGLGDDTVWSVSAVGTTVYAATNAGLAISTDGGASFTARTTAHGLGSNTVQGVYAVGTTVYAATNGGLSISTDGGASFTARTTAHGLGSNTVQGVYAVGMTVYAATNGGGLAISTDGGASFTTRTTADGLPCNNARTVYALGSTVYVAGCKGFAISTDGGASFTYNTTANGLGANSTRGVFVTPTSIYVGTNGGLSISQPPTEAATDGLSFGLLSIGLLSTGFSCPPTDQLGFAVGPPPNYQNTSTDPIFCSYPAFEGEDPNDFFCTYSFFTGAGNGQQCRFMPTQRARVPTPTGRPVHHQDRRRHHRSARRQRHLHHHREQCGAI